MPQPSTTDIAEQLVAIRGKIGETEHRAARARTLLRVMTGIGIGVVSLLAAAIAANLVFASSVDLAPMWTVAGWTSGTGLAALFVLSMIWAEKPELFARRKIEHELDTLYEKQAHHLSGEKLPVEFRQYAYRGAMLRSIQSTRKSGDRYRRVNNTFQSVIIVGSLATTAVASLNTGEGALKWIAVVISFTVGLSAGFTGYFKYRERAFYLRQTADDLEEQLNAYELGLTPYDDGAEADRIALLTARMETIRVAQQQREQQLDQPKAATRDT